MNAKAQDDPRLLAESACPTPELADFGQAKHFTA